MVGLIWKMSGMNLLGKVRERLVELLLAPYAGTKKKTAFDWGHTSSKSSLSTLTSPVPRYYFKTSIFNCWGDKLTSAYSFMPFPSCLIS